MEIADTSTMEMEMDMAVMLPKRYVVTASHAHRSKLSTEVVSSGSVATYSLTSPDRTESGILIFPSMYTMELEPFVCSIAAAIEEESGKVTKCVLD